MTLTTLILQVVLFLLKVGLGLAIIMAVSYLGVLVYDEIAGKSNELYELWLTVVIGLEFLVKGKPKVPTYDYVGRHRKDEPFISDLVIEMRNEPLSLCYREEVA